MNVKARIRKCEACGEYTLKEVCVRCGARTVSPLPPRFSPTDRYGKYRRMLKRERGLRALRAGEEKRREGGGKEGKA
ncbi:MAG: RNA-protein complex protein Nop10 [Candidatus Methanospirare jalkutatii]|nr:RNA-protein complex protein Nop10 [Candidatus Methanospirare jalkutatii]